MNKSPNASRAILARCRRPFFGRLQLIVILFWTFVPAFRTGAIYVPDETNTPPYCWIPLETEDPEPSGGPDMGDANLNDVPDWLDAFHVATTDGTLV